MRHLEKDGVQAESTVLSDSPPHEAVIRAARSFGADLIMAERHPGGRYRTRALRSTDFELLRLSPVPVLLVKTRQPYDHPSVQAGVDPSHAHRADSARAGP